MSRKSSNKKSAAASWYHCEICNIEITSKERETHDKVCPIAPAATTGANGAPLEYIRQGCLYTTSVERRTFSIEELKDMPLKYQNNLLFMSEGAMRLANLHIGQPVVIRAMEQPQTTPPLVRSLWPIPEKFLTTLFANEEDYNLYWKPLKGAVLRIDSLPNEAAPPAKLVRLKMLPECKQKSKLNVRQLKQAERLLRTQLRELIFASGSRIQLNFYNKLLEFVVVSWSALGEEESAGAQSETEALTQAIGSLSLSTSEEFFKVTIATHVEVEEASEQSSESVNRKEHAKYFVTKADIGGLDTRLQLIEETMEYALGFRIAPKGIKIARGLLLYGPSGCGKSMICEAMCAAVHERIQPSTATKTHITKINTSELFSKFLGETERNLLVHFEEACANYPQPTLIVIEDVHNLCPRQETNEVAKRAAAAFLSMLDSLGTRKEAQRIFVLATTTHIDALSPSVRRCGRLDFEVEIGAPMPKERASILRCLLHAVDHELADPDIEEIAQITHGFVGADLANLISNATLALLKTGDATKLSATNLRDALTYVKPSAMREVLIENPNVHWSDIGGQAELQLKLRQAIEWPLLYADKFQHLGIKPPRGLLMFGPPGCSKTMIAKALATESQLNFISIKGPELFSMWVGESERAVREVFRKARQVAPAIVFFDEIDAIGGERSESAGSSGTSVKERVLTQLLTELDGVEALENVTVVAATNRPDMIDKALLRPGRIDRIIYVGLPDAAARREIFTIKLRAMPVGDDVSIDELVQRTEGYSGAEIQAVCHEAALKTLEESFDAAHVNWRHFEESLRLVLPRTSPELLRLYQDYMTRA